MAGITSGSRVMNSITGRRCGSFSRTQNAVGTTSSIPNTMVSSAIITE